ncbi:MAG TPA: D-Ala-D-Ala carboxypeptidase family metallohydrolase [Longimicrobium sp.]|nr:D-Ala-D-Ala carboxypeptidase family metallohydrolase [Longimicrobium sp.]
MEYTHDPFLFPLVREPSSRWERSGLSEKQERAFNRVATLLAGLFLVGWTYTLVFAPRADLMANAPPVARISSELIRSPLAKDAAPEPVFLVDQFVRSFEEEFEKDVGGQSGAIRVRIVQQGDTLGLPAGADSLPAGAQIALQPSGDSAGVQVPAGSAPRQSGIWNVVLQMRDAVRPASDVSVITLVPLSQKQGGRIGNYRIGNWPYEQGGAPKPVYRPPAGLIEVTPQNKETWLSEHIQLKDFLTKGQENVWPKYVAVQPRVLDKVELVIQELQAMGHPVENIFAVSGFRTPAYNAGGGNTVGRGKLSRHMYGDAMDIAVDNDNNGIMDDLNGDGRINLSDARVIGAAVDRVEAKYPNLVGGMHYYPPAGGHQGMVHIDTRGFRARW